MAAPTLVLVLSTLAVAAAQYDFPEYNLPPPSTTTQVRPVPETGSRCFCLPAGAPSVIETTILNQESILITKIKAMIEKSKLVEKDLTTALHVLKGQLEKERRERVKLQFQRKIQEVTLLLRDVQDKNIKCELNLHNFMIRVSTGQIKTAAEAHRILQNMYNTQVIPLGEVLNKVKSVMNTVLDVIKNVATGAVEILKNLFDIFKPSSTCSTCGR